MNDLLPRMEARPSRTTDVVTYRYRPSGGRPVNLGTDREAAIRQVRAWTSLPSSETTLDETTLLAALERHRKGAKQRGLGFSLSAADLLALAQRQRHRCAVTGLAFSNEKPPGLRIRPWAVSLDRKRSREGYVAGNVRLVCAFVNVAMNGFGEEHFRVVLKALIDQAVAERLEALGIPNVGTSRELDSHNDQSLGA